MSFVLDTHAIVWSLMDDPRLGGEARRYIATCSRQDLLISDISLLEMAMLLDRKRIEVTLSDSEFLEQITNAFRVVPITAAIAAHAVSLGLPHGDPFDRVIAATAQQEDCTLLTRDRLLTDFPTIRTAW